MTETQRRGSWEDWTNYIMRSGNCSGCALIWLQNGSVLASKNLRMKRGEGQKIVDAFKNFPDTQSNGFKIGGKDHFCIRMEAECLSGQEKQNGSRGVICYKSLRCLAIGTFDKTKSVSDVGFAIWNIANALKKSSF